MSMQSSTPVSQEQARAALDRYVAGKVREGARAEPLSPSSVVLVYKKPVKHVTHLIVTLLTGGLWLPVWVVLILRNKERRRTATVDLTGVVTEA